MQFVHLHLHTEYSISDGLIRLDDLLARAKALNMPAVTVTDLSNLFGMVKFYTKAIRAGIKPIIGAEIYIENPKKPTEPFRLVLLCQNQIGYHHLTQLISKAYTEGQQHHKPIVQMAWLEQWNAGLIALSGARTGDIGQALIAGKMSRAQACLERWTRLFPNRFYLELQRTQRAQETIYIQHALTLAEKYQVPVVATNDVCFMDAQDFEAHEARVCIHGSWILHDKRRPHGYSEHQHFKSAEAMIELFKDIPEAITNTVEIYKRCNLMLELNKVCLPDFPVPPNTTLEDYLAQAAQAGLEARLSQPSAPENVDKTIYHDRLQTELKVINDMGFAGYFLIVADFVRWSKDHHIPVGAGRGSGAGSLVAYALNITDIDPLRYDLLFERFLNPERVSMPDFDIDFCMEGRDKVIDYVSEKYGKTSVSQIITYGTMAAKAVVRDVGRVLGHPYGFVDAIAKLIPFELGMTLDKALEQEPALLERYKKEEPVRTLIDLARKLEGITRNVGKHAGGLVIAPTQLTDFSPLYCEPDGNNLVTQFDKNDIETMGLIKFDFLGLRTLTIIDWAVQSINRLHPDAHLDINTIPLDDPKTFELLKTQDATAIFQLESRGMQELIKRLQPDTFEDIVALVALYRPGPLQSGMVDDFIARKHGEARIQYPHPKLEPILKPTYGVILYQEQVMQIAQVLAGYSLGAADILRRAMGKKKPEEMAKQRTIFMCGATEQGVDKQVASYIFDLMEKFAGYGFNKSHSVAYALLAYQTAWLKTHYPAEFMAAVLSSDMDNTDKVVKFLNACQGMQLTVLPPDINRSHYQFVVENGNILHGLGAVKGAGEAAIQNIITERHENGSFQDLFGFCRRIDLRKANRRVLEALIKSGSMDALGPFRAILFASLDNAVRAAEQYAHNQTYGQTDLFGNTDQQGNHYPEPEWVKTPPWSTQEKLQYEKETLGFYNSGHPIDEYAEELQHIVSAPIARLKVTGKNTTATIAGLVTHMRTMQTKRGKRMAFLTLNDQSGQIEVAIFSDAYEKFRALLQKDKLLILTCEINTDDYTGGLKATAQDIMTMNTARDQRAKHLHLTLHKDNMTSECLDKLHDTLTPHLGGHCPVCVTYQHNHITALLPLGDTWRVQPSDTLLNDLRHALPHATVQMKY